MKLSVFPVPEPCLTLHQRQVITKSSFSSPNSIQGNQSVSG